MFLINRLTSNFCLLIIALCILPDVAAQSGYDSLPVIDYSRPGEYIVRDVTVSGLQHLDPIVIRNVSGLQTGKRITVPGDDITQAIQKLWDQGLFSDVKITATRTEGMEIDLDIFLQEPPRLSTLNIEGLRRSELSDIEEKIKLRSGSLITENTLNNTKDIIEKHFIEKGFFNTSIEIFREDDPSLPNRVRLTINVDKNERVRIADIYFIGNEHFTDGRLRRVMKNTKKRNLNIFKASKFVGPDFREDKESLLTFYNENGFRDATIVSDSIYAISENRINLAIRLDEGNRYYFRDINWVGNTKYPSEYLSAVLGIEKGEVYDQTKLENRLRLDDDAVSSIYLDDGYLFFTVNPVEQRIDNDSIDLEMRIREGEQATINRVFITGNTKTNEHVIRRELRTKPGELFSKTKLIRSHRELANLGHFDPERLEVNPIPNPEDGTVDIEYSVEEKANDQLEISGGWGAGMLIGTLGVRFSNFSTKNFFKKDAWRPLPSGDGQTLSIRAQSNGSYYQAYNLTFVEPYVGGTKPNSLSFSVFHTIQTNRYNRNVQDWSSIKISGASLGMGRRLNWPDDFFTLYNELSFQNYVLDDWFGQFLFQDGISNNLSLRTSFERNSVDQPIYPRRGNSFNLTLQITPPYSLINNKDYSEMPSTERYKWIEYHKWTFKGNWYTSLAGNLVLSTSAQFGMLGYFNEDIGPSPFESFDLGGDGMSGYNLYGRETIGLRGYENGSLTPIRSGNKAGNIYNKFNMELRYPVSTNPNAFIYPLVFVEAGNAWYDFNEFNPFAIKRSAGIGLRAFLPMFGLLGIDWAYGFDDIPGRPGANKGQFHFVLGQQF
ncbi:MAG: outer membrane protein assembly factor BamA [Bacteroidales bacterium]